MNVPGVPYGLDGLCTNQQENQLFFSSKGSPCLMIQVANPSPHVLIRIGSNLKKTPVDHNITDSSRGLSRKIREEFVKTSRNIHKKFMTNS